MEIQETFCRWHQSRERITGKKGQGAWLNVVSSIIDDKFTTNESTLAASVRARRVGKDGS
ncbi:hypothetical protein JMJ77_0014276 [Colletotrichum scovillei]|uniref:Uncharacterized protein n=1 Tax=Colletotrichum scovillei TaxID=1209932 RepID=A0A9P7UHB0_9PEZI|nr:hypothetical protein JMJ77_0014276 [Colletotrichum scovillei]KAG7065805.1 hypothetical protein JMJ78_0012551 [Colletotrichum scovillei]KAG7068405.1 hypothetical protein JMJ76_0008094 [Colletotrichum scovillei]